MTFTVCFTGLSGSGKTTLARALLERMKKKGITCTLVDGDELRDELGGLFGYTREERMKNSHVVRVLCRHLNENGIHVLCAIVAPYEEMRAQLRAFLGEHYIEVFVSCSVNECANRDVKGYYARVSAGTMTQFNGADDVYEIPVNSDLTIETGTRSVEECIDEIMRYLERRGI